MNKYDELMARRELMVAEWMALVALARAQGLTHEDVWSIEPVLRKNGALWMPIHHRNGRQIDMWTDPGDTEIRYIPGPPVLDTESRGML